MNTPQIAALKGPRAAQESEVGTAELQARSGLQRCLADLVELHLQLAHLSCCGSGPGWVAVRVRLLRLDVQVWVWTCRLAEWMVNLGERPEITGEAVAYDTALPAAPTGPLDADRVWDAVAIRLMATSAHLRRQAEGKRSDILDEELTLSLLASIARQLETAASSVERLR